MEKFVHIVEAKIPIIMNITGISIAIIVEDILSNKNEGG